MKLTYDSRKVRQGDTFLALVGHSSNGHDYIEQALRNGAKKVIAEYGNYDVETLIVPDTRDYLSNYLKSKYKEEIEKIKIVGITGTNGKTTSAYLLYQALNKLNIKAAYIGTIGFYLEDNIKELKNTTPDLLELYEMFLECSEKNVEYIVMEVSSHALDMDRVLGIEFDYAVFTNLTQDHLDYHLDMNNYSKAKQKLFKNLKNDGLGIVNSDDEYKLTYMVHNNTVTYGLNSGDVKIDKYEISLRGTKFKIGEEEFYTSLIGKHNLYNLLVVIVVLNSLDIDIEKQKEIIASLNSPKGRSQMVPYNDNIIVIDYAHTPDAVYNIINSFDKIEHNRIITIIGCGGNRDKAKRPKMGKIATRISDYVIFTSDNPRDEDPNHILEDIVSSLDANNYETIENRKEAILKGIQILGKNDILLVLGKGHEEYQIIKNEKIHFSDLEIIKDFIQ